MSPRQVTQRIMAAMEAGGLSRREAEIALGFVLLEAAFDGDFTRPQLNSPYATFYRRCRILGRLGLLRESRCVEPVDVDW